MIAASLLRCGNILVFSSQQHRQLSPEDAYLPGLTSASVRRPSVLLEFRGYWLWTNGCIPPRTTRAPERDPGVNLQNFQPSRGHVQLDKCQHQVSPALDVQPACPSHDDGDSDRTLGTFHNRGGTVSSTFETTSCQGVALPSSCPADLTPSFRRALRVFSLFLEVCALKLRSPLGYATQIASAVTAHCPAAMRNQWAGLLSSSRHGRPGRREGRNQNCRPA